MSPRSCRLPLLPLAAAFALTLFVTPPAATAQVGVNTSVLNPNLATEAELLALPHMSQDLVDVVVENRPYLSITALDALLAVSLDETQRKQLYVELFVPIDLNSATDAEVALVPGMGPKMAHEFEEYRPYKALAQFRREIGKYVDDTELARLEQYVFVPIDLNSASDEAILSIPGVGKKMLHEFKEYRPYVDLAQFRREIGKYVDDDELARLQRYVVIAEPAVTDVDSTTQSEPEQGQGG